MALRLTSKGGARFVWADDAMEAQWTLRPDDSEEELIRKMRLIVGFIEARGTPLPERSPGVALEMAQMTHPAPEGNGWASTVQPTVPELPEDRRADWELMSPEEQGNG